MTWLLVAAVVVLLVILGVLLARQQRSRQLKPDSGLRLPSEVAVMVR